MNREEKNTALEILYQQYKNCQQCPLALLGRSTIVFGSGNVMSKIIFIGEGPGNDEDLQGLPFVGKSGKLLTKMLSIAGIDRNNVFITNIVKCRPPHNRKPTEQEAQTCKDLILLKQIEIIKPTVLCTLGSVSLNYITNSNEKITVARGRIATWNNIALVPTFHPAYILRNPAALHLCIEDLIKVASLTQ